MRGCGRSWRTKHLRAFSLMAGLTTAGFMVVPFISTFMVRNVGMTESQLKYIFLSGGLCTLFSMNLIGRLADMYGRMRLFTIMAILSSGAVLRRCISAHSGPAHCRGDQRVHGHDDGTVRPGHCDDHRSVEARHRGGFMSLKFCVQQTFSGLGKPGRLFDHRPGRQPLQNYDDWLDCRWDCYRLYRIGRPPRGDLPRCLRLMPRLRKLWGEWPCHGGI